LTGIVKVNSRDYTEVKYNMRAQVMSRNAKQYYTTREAAKATEKSETIAAALATLSREHMEPDLAAMVLDSLGLTVKDLEAAGADPCDPPIA
jgi:hypothetical protein